MKQTFITSISLQGRQGAGGLEKVLYTPVDFSMEKNRESSFPIIPIISEFMGTNCEDVEIIVILPQDKNAKTNYPVFIEELKDMGLDETNVKTITPGENLGKQGSIKLLMELLDKISDDSLIYMDITFNTKPMSAMQLYAAHFVEKMKDVEVKGIYYGEYIPKHTVIPKLHDLTMFKYLFDLTGKLEQLGVKDIRGVIRNLIGE